VDHFSEGASLQGWPVAERPEAVMSEAWRGPDSYRDCSLHLRVAAYACAEASA